MAKTSEKKTSKTTQAKEVKKPVKKATAKEAVSSPSTPKVKRPAWNTAGGRRRHERKIKVLSEPIRLDPSIDSKYVADVIDFEKDIEPFKVIEIVSGVGSGKNYWVETVLAKKYRVLEVTSRRKTADAQAYDLKAADKLKKVNKAERKSTEVNDIIERVNQYCNEAEETEYKDAVITYYQMELYCKYSHHDNLTKLADYFDFIIFDEFHATIQDAGFQTSSPSVYHFINQCIEDQKQAKIIFMTATPGPVQKWIDKIEAKVHKKYFNPIDLYDECHHVITEQVIVHGYAKIADVLRVDLKMFGRKVIYFTHTIKQASELVAIAISLGIPEEKIGIDYADDPAGENDETAKKLKIPETVLANRQRIKKSLKPKLDKNGKQLGEYVPKDIQFFVTTGVNREGINIRNKDIDSIYIESMNNCEVNQILGRLRNGVRCAHLLFGYPETGENPKLRLFIVDYNYNSLKNVNDAFRKYGPPVEAPVYKLLPFINHICDRFEYIAWNGGFFQFNWQRAYEHELRARDIEDLKWAIENWSKEMSGQGTAIEAAIEAKECASSASEYLDMAAQFEEEAALEGYTEEFVKETLEEYQDNPEVKKYFEELLKRKEKTKKEMEAARRHDGLTGKQFLQTYWFPYSELLLDPYVFNEAIAYLRDITVAVNKLMLPYVGKAISEADKNLIASRLELALWARGTNALTALCLCGFLYSVDADGNFKSRNLHNHKQTANVLNLFGYDLKDTTSHKVKSKREYTISRCEAHLDVVRVSGLASDYTGRPDIEADMNIEKFGKLMKKGLVNDTTTEKPGINSMFYETKLLKKSSKAKKETKAATKKTSTKQKKEPKGTKKVKK